MPLDENRRLVQFIHNCSPYTANDKAAFPVGQAQKLVQRGIATYVSAEALEREARENFERELKRKKENDDVDDDTDSRGESDDDDESDADATAEGSEKGSEGDGERKRARKGKAGKRRRVRA